MSRPVTRRGFLAATGLAAVAGCLGGPARDDPATASPTPSPAGWETTPGDATGPGPPTRAADLPLPMAPAALQEESLSGGVPKDGIPAIDAPEFEAADAAAERLDPGEPVFGLAVGDDVRAYPQAILVHHEICNDVVADRPVSVTYCPLTGTVMAFARGETTFGVSGRLLNNNLIMYDRATETWWPQVLATAIPGPWNDEPPSAVLREFRVVWTTWRRWMDRHPETRVLTEDTGYIRAYGRDPYGSYNPRVGYYAPEAAPMFPTLSSDDRLPTKAVVIGARAPEGAVAFRKETLREAGLLAARLGETPVLAAYDPGLDTGYVYRNPEAASFEYRDGALVDETDTAHPPDALPLERVYAFDAMWFAWSGFYPETTLTA